MKKRVMTLGVVTMFFLFPLLLQAQEQYLILGPADFTPFNDEADYVKSGKILYSSVGDTTRNFYAPIHLPQGVRLKRVILFYYDNDASGNVKMYVTRENLYTSDDNTICIWESTGTSALRQIQSISASWMYNLISNTGYTYYLRIIFTHANAGSNNQFLAARIVYQ